MNDKRIRLRTFLIFFLLFIAIVFIPVYGRSVAISEEDYFEKDRICLAKNIYYEARGQGLVAQIAVSLVVLNRVTDTRYPNTICEVIYQGPTYSWKPTFPVRHKCQFSWYCDGKSDKPREKRAWKKALIVSDYLLSKSSAPLDFTEGATHYHSKNIVPHWAAHLTRVTKIEDHIFYRLEP